MVNVRRIVKYQEQIEGQKKIPLSPIEIASEKEHKVKKILDRRERRGKPKYSVRWKGYIAEEDTWERLDNLKHIRELVEEFKKEIREEEVRQVEKRKGKQKVIEVELNQKRRSSREVSYWGSILL